MDRLTIMIKLLHYKKLAKIEMRILLYFLAILLQWCFKRPSGSFKSLVDFFFWRHSISPIFSAKRDLDFI